jgi:acetyl-CoA C-acetyltransferase
MRRAAVVAPVRTPVGRFGGALKTVPVEDLAATAVLAAIERSGIDPGKIAEVTMAQSYASSEVPCIGRWVALHAGLPLEVSGIQVDRRCGSGLQSLVTAAMMVQTGVADAVVAGGVESMSNIEYYTTDMRWGSRSGNVRMWDRLDRGRQRSQPAHRFGEISGMIETAENLARDYAITREASDAFAVRSHRRAAAAWSSGLFEQEVVPVRVTDRKGSQTLVARDEGVRPDADLAALAALRPVIPDGTVTAGNSSQQNDAAAACLIVAEDKLDELGVEPMGYLVGWAAVGCEPSRMGIGPVPAVAKLFAQTGLGFDDLDLVELNEAFAVQVLAVLKGWQWHDEDKLNVNGSGISLGHPIGATGIRMTTTLLHELRRRDGRYGLVTMCVGGGQGMAAIFESAR